MMKEKAKEKNWFTGPVKWVLGAAVVLGAILILADALGEPKQTGGEETAAYAQTTVPAESVLLADPEPETVQTEETRPAEQQPLPTSGDTAAYVLLRSDKGPVPYEMWRWDRSYVNGDGKQQMTYYFDYPQFLSDEAAYVRINEAIYGKVEAFMTEMTQQQIETPVMSVYNTPTECIYTMQTQISHNGDGIISLLYTRSYYMGGNHSIKNTEAVTYSLETGETVGLAQLAGMEEGTLLEQLRERSYLLLKAEAGPMLTADAQEVLARYTLEDFAFHIQEGEIVLLFDTYELTSGAAGPQFVRTGLYIAND